MKNNQNSRKIILFLLKFSKLIICSLILNLGLNSFIFCMEPTEPKAKTNTSYSSSNNVQFYNMLNQKLVQHLQQNNDQLLYAIIMNQYCEQFLENLGI